mgnify:CR=1 FL=1
MESFQKFVELLRDLLTWWFFVQPWEKAIRVRAGKHTVMCEPGTHFRIPFVDSVYIHNTRRRVLGVPATTLSSADGRVVVASCVVGFVVSDVLKMHTDVNDPEGVLRQRLLQATSEFFLTSSGDLVNPTALKQRLDSIDTSDLGLGAVETSVANFASV